MDITTMLAELRSEREQLDEAILALERLARGGGKRRGRPPKWMSAATHEASRVEEVSGGPKKRGRKKRVVSAEARAKMAAAQKRRWAAARKAEAAS